MVGESWATDPPARKAYPALLECLQDADFKKAGPEFITLAKIGGAAAIPLLLRKAEL